MLRHPPRSKRTDTRFPSTTLVRAAETGVAASLIADQAPKSAPIVATCDGPRTRIYCLFYEDAIDGDDANEEVLGFEPLKGDWGVSLDRKSTRLNSSH